MHRVFLGYFQFVGQGWQPITSGSLLKNAKCTTRTPEREAKESTKAASDSPTRHGQHILVVQQLCPGSKGKW